PALYAIARELRQAGLANIVLGNEPRVALEYLRTEPAAATALGMLGRFLRQHGHRARIEGELRFPRWSEAPEQVVAALVGYLQDPPVRDPREVEAATRRQLRERE